MLRFDFYNLTITELIMKKTFTLLVLICFMASCGPKRLGCGPRSCMNEIPNSNQNPNHNVA